MTSDAAFSVETDDSDGESLANRYQMLEELGSGSFGVVYKAIEKETGEIVAVKHVDLESSEEDLSDILSELAVLSSCSSPHVTKYRRAFLRRQTLWIVMEYLGGGSCADLLKPQPHCISEAHIAIIMKELLLGLTYLHSEGKLHRDIKAANVLLGMDGRVKLADFGVAAQLVGLKSVRNTFVGTPFWMAPEVIMQEGHDAKADVWSLGITAMELAKGEPPMADTHPMKVLFLIPKQAAPRLEDGGKWSKEFRDFVAMCLTKDMERRPSAKELLRHKFVKGAGKVEGLQELILRKQEWDASKGGEKNLKYYAETMRNLNGGGQDDDWLFDTVKAMSSRNLRNSGGTQRRRKTSEVRVIDDTEVSNGFEGLSIQENSERSTMRKVSTTSQPQQQEPDRPSPNSVRQLTKKRVPSAQSRQPLGVNMSFGNSPSTVRQFRRVSPDAVKNARSTTPETKLEEKTEIENEDPTPDPNSSVIRTPSKPKPKQIVVSNPFASISASDAELMPPPHPSPSKSAQLSSPSKGSRFSTATTLNDQQRDSKEAVLGRRLYSKAIGISCQEVLDTTADDAKREAVARLAESFSDLEAVDPEGMYAIMTSVIAKMKADSKLCKLLPQPTPAATPVNSQPSTAQSTLNTPKKGAAGAVGAKLIMAQNNPHLKSHRRRQSAQVLPSPRGEVSRESSQVWSPKSDKSSRSGEGDGDGDLKGWHTGQLEHTKQLSEVLFERWVDGVRGRWPAV